MNSMEFQHENASNLKKGRTLEHAKASVSEQHSDQGHDESDCPWLKTSLLAEQYMQKTPALV